MTKPTLYPLQFEPILKEKVWGGEKLNSLFNKPAEGDCVGESWEISDVKGNPSIVSNGALQGKSLPELIKTYQEDLVGAHVYEQFGEKFPLLIKFIDAKLPLSIQVHPNNELAQERHNSFGKTEMWYIMHAEEGGNLIVGFQKDSNAEEYVDYLNTGRIKELLNDEPVNEGDVFFIPTGRVHAIGGGVLLAEIQQTSDITYRIYDWDRPDQNGNMRELHTELALDAIDYQAQERYSTPYQAKENEAVELVSCDYFTTNQLKLEQQERYEITNDKDCFLIYLCVKGNCELHYGDGQQVNMACGQTILVPASLKAFYLRAEDATLLEVYIK